MITKEQVLENIKAKMVKNQKISDRTILESVESLLKFATEETTLEDFVSTIYPALDSVNRNHIADVANDIKAYKEANPIPAPTPPNPKPTETKTTEQILLDKLDALSIEISGIKNEKTTETNKTKFVAGLKTKGVDDKFINEYLSIVKIDAGTNVDEEIEKGTTFFNTVKAAGDSPTPNGGGGTPKPDVDFSDIVEKKK
jgi:hypothetical protein